MQGLPGVGHPVRLRVLGLRELREPGGRQTGDVPLPARGEKLLGGHAVLAVGYDDATQRFLVRTRGATGGA